MGILFGLLGLSPSDDERKVMETVKKSYSSLRVVGRGTVVINPADVIKDDNFKVYYKKAAEIVKEK
ncbi:hypothetical protein [Fluviicoccus keumensis]|nr:hypothetical protein [Fluviicoccus keumensis]